MSPVTPDVARISGWDRAAIVALGGAGCALSYDALVQMATAIHVRGFLTFLFPLVIDGFIAYGVRALLVLRTAPLAARCYVWLLFGTATAASIWANALHAVRLNQQLVGGGLRLGDVTVGILSTLAPLALAGAVHLYILIARRAVTEDTTGHPGQPDTSNTLPAQGERPRGDRSAKTGQRGGRAAPARTVPARTGQRGSVSPPPRPVTGRTPGAGTPDEQSGDPVGLPEPEPQHAGHPSADRMPRSVTTTSRPHPTDRSPVPADKQGPDGLLPVARRAVTDAGKVTRQVVADAVRGQGIPLSNDRLTVLMAQLRAEDKPTADTAGS